MRLCSVPPQQTSAMVSRPIPVRARHATAAAKALQAAGAKHIYLAGRPGEQEAALRAAGVNDFIFAGGDALAMLQESYRLME